MGGLSECGNWRSVRKSWSWYQYVHSTLQSLPVLPPLPNDAKSWVDTAGRQNLNLLASNFAVTAAEGLKQRKAGHAPTLDAVAQYERGDNDALGFSNPNAFGTPYRGDVEQRTVGLRLNIPLCWRRPANFSSPGARSYSRLDQTEQQRRPAPPGGGKHAQPAPR